MRMKKFIAIGMILVLGIMLTSFVSAYMRSTPQFTQYGSPGGFGFDRSSLEFDKSMCDAGQDFVIQIAPFGCSPAVVRSDLLEEQNVPVFCQLAATKINPLIDVEAIEGLSFKGEYPPEVAGVGFQPARAALGVRGNLNSPVLENIGYAVIVLRKQENSSKMPDFVTGNLSVKIKYDIKSALGIGRASFYLPSMTDAEWDENRLQYGFWDGRGYLRVEEVGIDAAKIAIYDDTGKLRVVPLQKGKTSNKVTLPGFDCLATLQLKLDGLVNPDTRVKLRIGGDIVEVAKKEKFLEGKCYVTEMTKFGASESVTISCREDESSGIPGLGNKPLTLINAPRLKFNLGGEEKIVGLGEPLFDYVDDKKVKRDVYLAYVGSVKGAKDIKAVLMGVPSTSLNGKNLTTKDLVYAHKLVKAYTWEGEGKQNLGGALKDIAQGIRGVFSNLVSVVVQGDKTEFVDFGETRTLKTFGDAEVTFVGFASSVDEEFGQVRFAEINNNYEKAKEDYEVLIENFGNEKCDEASKKTYGEQALQDYMLLAKKLKQMKTVAKLCDKFKEDYPKSATKPEIRSICDEIKLASSGTASSSVYINGRLRSISLEGIYEPTAKEYGAQILVKGPNGKSDTITLQKDEVYYLDSFRFKKKSVIDLGNGFGIQYSELKDKKGWFWRAPNLLWAEIDYAKISKHVGVNGLSKSQASFINSLKDKTYEEGTLIIAQYMGSESIQLKDLDIGKAKVRVSVSKGVTSTVKDFLVSDNEVLELEKARVFGSYSFALIKVNLTQSARVSVLPGIENQGSNTTFQFKVGIEKRSIQLSPEKTKEKIENINATIEEWEDRSESMGELVETLKTACLAVEAIFTVKNFLSNLGGKGIARQNVMRGEGGWTEYCKEEVADKKFSSMSACYSANGAKIESDVNVAARVISQQNADIKTDQMNTRVDGVVDNNQYMENALPRVQENLDDSTRYYIDDKGKQQDMGPLLTQKAYTEERTFTKNELREIDYNLRIINEPASSESMRAAAHTNLQSVYGSVYDASADHKKRADAKLLLGSPEVDQFFSEKLKTVKYTTDITAGDLTETNTKKAKIADDANVRTLVDRKDNKKYLVTIDDKGVVTSTYEVLANGDLQPMETIKGIEGKTPNPLKLEFEKIDAASYNNAWKGIPEVRYFETEPYKGLPETVPVDVKKGWYASIRQTIPIGGQIRAYEESGRVSSFYLCNIGTNQLEERRGGDDLCTLVNTGTGQAYNQIAGLSKPEANRLIGQAIKAIEDASKQYRSGLSGQIRILGQTARVGAPAANIPAVECEDFMSPQDCRILFNVCDPVICPSSRCNLGGTFPVKDVIQSGIVGSIVLCLPNFPQVIVPICLTGIKAGIDGWVSILTSHRDCLQDSLDSGKMTGICDEIYSVHSCQFFWRQIIPIVRLGLPRLLSSMAGQGTRGGGEYLGVQNSWDNAEKSLNYFKQDYAKNSFKAFEARSVEQVGDDVCQNQISGIYPSGDFLDTFVEPDSPSQFHGRFDEIPFTTATNPPTSQYKVFYHIYAGNDRGGYYKVFLKGDSGSSYYQDVGISRMVAQGYVKKGEYASETKDFTAPSGYKELCINVNGQEECGFKQVSTAFVVDYVNDKYIQDQASQTDIKSEAECVSGSASAYSLLSPNMEGAADEVLNPAVYKRGIIRVCASKNPGATTDVNAGVEGARWRPVGNCGDSKMICWLDTQSVKDVVHSTAIEGEVLADTNENSMKVLNEAGDLLDGASFYAEVLEIRDEEDKNERIGLINAALAKVFYNHQRAELFLLRAGAYGELAIEAFKESDKEVTQARLVVPGFGEGDELLAEIERREGEKADAKLAEFLEMDDLAKRRIAEEEYQELLKQIEKDEALLQESIEQRKEEEGSSYSYVPSIQNYKDAIKKAKSLNQESSSTEEENKAFIEDLFIANLITFSEKDRILGTQQLDENLGYDIPKWMDSVTELLEKKDAKITVAIERINSESWPEGYSPKLEEFIKQLHQDGVLTDKEYLSTINSISDVKQILLKKQSGEIATKDSSVITVEDINGELLYITTNKLEGSYTKNEKYINSLFVRGFLTEEEFKDLAGVGGWFPAFDFEGDMNDVKKILITKRSILTASKTPDTPLETTREASSYTLETAVAKAKTLSGKPSDKVNSDFLYALLRDNVIDQVEYEKLKGVGDYVEQDMVYVLRELELKAQIAKVGRGGEDYQVSVSSSTSVEEIRKIRDFLQVEGRNVVINGDLTREHLAVLGAATSFYTEETTLIIQGRVEGNIGGALNKGIIRVVGDVNGDVGTVMSAIRTEEADEETGEYFPVYSKAEIIIQGSVSGNVGERMNAGSISVSGTVYGNVGESMNEYVYGKSLIVIAGDVRGEIGKNKIKGIIKVKGTTY